MPRKLFLHLGRFVLQTTETSIHLNNYLGKIKLYILKKQHLPNKHKMLKISRLDMDVRDSVISNK